MFSGLKALFKLLKKHVKQVVKHFLQFFFFLWVTLNSLFIYMFYDTLSIVYVQQQVCLFFIHLCYALFAKSILGKLRLTLINGF